MKNHHHHHFEQDYQAYLDYFELSEHELKTVARIRYESELAARPVWGDTAVLIGMWEAEEYARLQSTVAMY